MIDHPVTVDYRHGRFASGHIIVNRTHRWSWHAMQCENTYHVHVENRPSLLTHALIKSRVVAHLKELP